MIMHQYGFSCSNHHRGYGVYTVGRWQTNIYIYIQTSKPLKTTEQGDGIISSGYAQARISLNTPTTQRIGIELLLPGAVLMNDVIIK